MKATPAPKNASKKRASAKESTNEHQIFLIGGIGVAVLLIVLYFVFRNS